MLTADAELDALLCLAAALRANHHELTDTGLVNRLERIALEKTELEVCRHHARLNVVAAETECELREVVRTE